MIKVILIVLLLVSLSALALAECAIVTTCPEHGRDGNFTGITRMDSRGRIVGKYSHGAPDAHSWWEACD